MSTPSRGDRVRVEFEGEITAVWDKSCDIKFPEGPNGEYVPEAEYVPLTAVTVLAQPVKVGDEITGDVAYGLPVGSVVLYEPGGGASVKVSDDAWARDPDEGYEAIYRPSWYRDTPFRVLHLGRAA